LVLVIIIYDVEVVQSQTFHLLMQGRLVVIKVVRLAVEAVGRRFVVIAGKHKWLAAHGGRSLLAAQRDRLIKNVVVAVLDAGAIALDYLNDVSLLCEICDIKFNSFTYSSWFLTV
jgi:hypothetical protein